MSKRSPTSNPTDLAESIAAQDLNNLYLTSCYFADVERYRAFCSMYALMRVVDDRIDDLPLQGELSPAGKEREHAVARAWQRALFVGIEGKAPPTDIAALCGRPDAFELVESAVDAIRRFPVPLSLWNNFFAAMHRDIGQARFPTYEAFLDYAEGASVAPTSVYLYLIASRKSPDGTYRLPEGFDLIRCGRHLGVFAYLAHIVRDLARDLSVGERGLLYLAADDLERFGLTEEHLQQDLQAGRSRAALRALVEDVASRARESRAGGVELLEPLEGILDPDCAYILDLIVAIYDRVLDKLETVAFDPLGGRHRLSFAEKRETAVRVGERVGFSPIPRVPIKPARSPD